MRATDFAAPAIMTAILLAITPGCGEERTVTTAGTRLKCTSEDGVPVYDKAESEREVLGALKKGDLVVFVGEEAGMARIRILEDALSVFVEWRTEGMSDRVREEIRRGMAVLGKGRQKGSMKGKEGFIDPADLRAYFEPDEQ